MDRLLVDAVEAGVAGIDAALAADAGSSDAPHIWRVASLRGDPGKVIVDVVVGRRSLLDAIAGSEWPSGSSFSRDAAESVVSSLATTRSVNAIEPKDTLTIALDKAAGRVDAFEFTTSPTDVWQGRQEPQPDGSMKLETRKLVIPLARVRVRKAVLVGAELHKSFVDAGLSPIDDLLAMLDDALDGHAELSDIRPGARLRLIATQDRADDVFVRWVSLEAVEYFPAAPSASSVRVYRFDPDGDRESDGKRHHGWYDAKGRQPLHGGWRTPVPLARITSRFNPHRMHPILHVVMPHNGVDFGAPVGTPVYATAAGTVTSVGLAGPCGKRVEIAHAGGIVSFYCHLSRYASGLRAGLHVEQRQVIAYVGQTGRVTGPHLHFGILRNGVIIDPMSLRLDGVRVVPRSMRDEFERRRVALDAELDGVPLPAAGGAVAEPTEPDTFYEEP